jgi:uncharacterized protein (DUF433 family)
MSQRVQPLPPSPAPLAGRTPIRKTPGVAGGEACIGDTRVTVWGLVQWRRLGLSDTEILERTGGLTPEDLRAAWEYYEQHPAEIDRAIAEDAAA